MRLKTKMKSLMAQATPCELMLMTALLVTDKSCLRRSQSKSIFLKYGRFEWVWKIFAALSQPWIEIRWSSHKAFVFGSSFVGVRNELKFSSLEKEELWGIKYCWALLHLQKLQVKAAAILEVFVLLPRRFHHRSLNWRMKIVKRGFISYNSLLQTWCWLHKLMRILLRDLKPNIFKDLPRLEMKSENFIENFNEIWSEWIVSLRFHWWDLLLHNILSRLLLELAWMERKMETCGRFKNAWIEKLREYN